MGIVARSDVLTADSQLAADLTQLPTLQKQLDQATTRSRCSPAGARPRWPGARFDIDNSRCRGTCRCLPSRLVRQRPDVLAAEAQLHAASAAIGVAVAQEFPDRSTVGLAHARGAAGADLFHSSIRSGVPAGASRSRCSRAGRCARRCALRAMPSRPQAATYQAVVLEALGQVADDLWALQYDAQLSRSIDTRWTSRLRR